LTATTNFGLLAYESTVLETIFLQKLLSSTVHITKGIDYDVVAKPWLGEGLLIATGIKPNLKYLTKNHILYKQMNGML